jgi:hypothetical protein
MHGFSLFREGFKSEGWKCLSLFERLAAAASKAVNKDETYYEEGEVNGMNAANDGQTRVSKPFPGALHFEYNWCLEE